MDCRAGNDIGRPTVCAPSAANTRAVARPMPLAAPVTSTVNPQPSG
jgi:hypothetical protein